MPKKLSMEEFCKEVERAVAEIPDEFQPWLENVVVDVVEEPSEEDWAQIEGGGPEDEDDELLGLFDGVAIDEQPYGEHHPNRVKIFRGPIVRISRDREEMRAIIRDTVLHELAHHFGYSEEDLDEFEERCWRELDGEE